MLDQAINMLVTRLEASGLCAGPMHSHHVNVFMHRCGFELVALLYRLRSKVHCRKIYEAELKASGCFE
jgi:hypothetical protein